MGQWGAFGYASVYGWGYQQILAHFYQGTTLSSLSSKPIMTVRLSELDGANLRAEALPGAALVASSGGTPLASGPALYVAHGGGTQSVYTGPSCAGPWGLATTTSSAVTVSSTGGATAATQASGIGASKVDVCLPSVGDRVYQGDIVTRTTGETDNVVPLEEYVAGVVPAESPALWQGLGGAAALEAQAVAARSYALAVTDGGAGPICDTSQCQVYEGWPVPYGLTADQAVQATAGKVLYCQANSGCGPAGSVALAEYSSSTGGYSAGGTFPAVPDLGDSVAANPVHSWSLDVPAPQVERAFPDVGTVLGVQVTQRNGLGQWGGRVVEAQVVGSAGTAVVSGPRMAADFGLRSDWFEVNGAPGEAPSSTTSTAPAISTTTSPPPTSTTPATPGSTTTLPSTTPPSPTPPSTTLPSTTIMTPPTLPPPGTTTTTTGGTNSDLGFWVAAADGDVRAYGAAAAYGTAAGTSLAGEVVAMASTGDGKGYWLAGRDGAVLAFGDAHWYGSAVGLQPSVAIVAMAVAPGSRGYWLVAQDGGVYAFGKAAFYGSARYTGPAGEVSPPLHIVGLAPTLHGRGYWLVSADGGVFSYGDARFYGSMGERRLPQPITGIVPSPDGHGYYLLARDGEVLPFGDAPALGSLPSAGVHAWVAALAAEGKGWGYYLVTTSALVYGFGHAVAQGVPTALSGPAVAIAPYR